MGRGRLHVGTSGYQYDHWRGRFYPRALARREWLAFYARHFGSVEINNTFYGLPAEQTFDAWRAAVPGAFCFALKFSRFGSHIKRLRDPEQSIPTFLERAERLGASLGPILVQLPPRWLPVPERLDAFLARAPRRHRWVIELRDERWLCDEVFEVLRRHGTALCVHDLIDDHPRLATANFVYLRFHGPGAKYRGGYSPQYLTARAKEIAGDLRRGRDVYAYFNNDAGGHALEDARRLRRYARG